MLFTHLEEGIDSVNNFQEYLKAAFLLDGDGVKFFETLTGENQFFEYYSKEVLLSLSYNNQYNISFCISLNYYDEEVIAILIIAHHNEFSFFKSDEFMMLSSDFMQFRKEYKLKKYQKFKMSESTFDKYLDSIIPYKYFESYFDTSEYSEEYKLKKLIKEKL